MDGLHLEEPVASVFLERLIDEGSRNRFGWLIGQKPCHFIGQAFSQQRPRSLGMGEQFLYETVVGLGDLAQWDSSLLLCLFPAWLCG